MKLTKQDIAFIFLMVIVALAVIVFIAQAAPPEAEAGQVTKLVWTAPTTNEDGSPLTDLAGYKIYCGVAATSPPYTISKDVGNVANYLLANIGFAADGMFKCVATAYDVWNNESAYSNSVEVLRSSGSFFGQDNIKPSSPGLSTQ